MEFSFFSLTLNDEYKESRLCIVIFCISCKKESDDDDNRRKEEEPPLRVSSPTGIEKGQREIESPGREKSNDEVSDNDSEMDADAYNFTEDQKRAMMELLVQKQEDNDLLGKIIDVSYTTY